MEITNLELIDIHRGLQAIGVLKVKKEDTPETKKLVTSIVSRVGLNLKKLRDEVEQYGEQHNDLLLKYSKRDSTGNPVPILNDKGEHVGIELSDIHMFNHELRNLSKLRIKIPDDLYKIKMSELLAVGFEIDGNLAASLGDILIHDFENVGVAT